VAVSKGIILTCLSQKVFHHVAGGGQENLLNLEVLHFYLLAFDLLKLNLKLTPRSYQELFVK
jgi:hypothetical protein